MGKISKGVECSVKGCGEPAVRSLSAQKVGAVLKINVSRGRAYLCEKHYKEYKKLTKEERRIERWRYMRV